jgi:hypothetical protein
MFCSPLLAQSGQVAVLFEQFQSPTTTDRADAALREMSRVDVEVRHYLASHLPPLIDKGPVNSAPWRNAVRLAGDMQIVEAIPDLVKWIGTESGSGLLTLTRVVRLENDLAGRALAQIGDPALLALAKVLDHGMPAQRTGALYALNLIGSPAAKTIFRNHLTRESDPRLKQYMERTLEDWQQPSPPHCGCDIIEHALDDFDQIKVGATRQVIEKHNFIGGAGLSSRDRTIYSYANCNDIQFQVEFSRDSNVLGDSNYSPNDVITKISNLSIRNPAN